MPLVANSLGLPECQEEDAFRAVDRVLRADPVLARVVGRNVFSWRGDALEDADPAPSMLPWLRITPAPGASSWETEMQHRMPMLVGIELAISGTNAGTMMRLWAAVREAICPRDVAKQQAVAAILQEARISKWTFSQPAYAVRNLGGDFKALVAAGTLDLLLLVAT